MAVLIEGKETAASDTEHCIQSIKFLIIPCHDLTQMPALINVKEGNCMKEYQGTCTLRGSLSSTGWGALCMTANNWKNAEDHLIVAWNDLAQSKEKR